MSTSPFTSAITAGRLILSSRAGPSQIPKQGLLKTGLENLMATLTHPMLTMSDSGILIDTPSELTDELFRHFSGDGVSCTVKPGGDPDSRRIVFLSPYAIDKIVALFQQWQEDRAKQQK